MSEISFYHLSKQSLDQALPALLEKVVEAGHRVVLRVAAKDAVRTIDDLLWTYRDDSFLAHGTEATAYASQQPIYITAGDDNPNAAKIVFCVNAARFEGVETYDRALYMFDGRDDEALNDARSAWKSLKAAGHSLTYWQQTPEGRWLKKDV